MSQNSKQLIFQFSSVFVLALVFWASISAGSSYLAEQPLREHGHQVKSKGQAIDNAEDQIEKLRAKAKSEPESASTKTELGYALLAQGVQIGDGAMLIEALKNFDEAIKIDPNQADAIMGLASVSLRVGVLERAATYYDMYLAIRPNDIRALSDSALTFIKQELYDLAEKRIAKAYSLDSRSAPVLMVYAMLEQRRGNIDKAKSYSKAALEYAENPQSKANIKLFLEELEGSSSKGADIAAKPPLAQYAKKFFESHSIIGPKLRDFDLSNKIITLELSDFPVEHMPQVAKERFLANISQEFNNFKTELDRVDIVDKSRGEVVLSIELN